jgi:hypothetical protein
MCWVYHLISIEQADSVNTLINEFLIRRNNKLLDLKFCDIDLENMRLSLIKRRRI